MAKNPEKGGKPAKFNNLMAHILFFEVGVKADAVSGRINQVQFICQRPKIKFLGPANSFSIMKKYLNKNKNFNLKKIN